MNSARAAFAFLTQLSARTGGIVKREDLRQFTFQGKRISLEQNMRGIRVVQGNPVAISILTTYRQRPEDRPYEDDIGPDGYPRYKWQGTDPQASDNVALRVAMELRKPLAWFVDVAPGLYEAVFPVWLVDEEADQHQFVVALDEAMETAWQQEVLLTAPDEVRRREYALGCHSTSPPPAGLPTPSPDWSMNGSARSANFDMQNSSMLPTSKRMRTEASRSLRTGSQCAPSTTERSTRSYSAYHPRTPLRFGAMFSMSATGRRSCTPSKASTERG